MTVALYVWRDDRSQHAFWKACGVDTLQLCDTHWALRADKLDAHYAALARDVASAKAAGFRVWMILFSNIAQWEGPSESEPTGMGVLFDPRDPNARAKRIASLRRAVRALKAADGFTFLAGDPGGAVGAGFGPRTLDDFLDLANDARLVVNAEAPGAAFHVNPWAIAYWRHPDRSCFTAAWWQGEAALTRALFDRPLGEGVGVEIPGHDRYRPLALRTLRDAGVAPDPLPTAADVRRLKGNGIATVWSWPYFLLDEADDGDAGPAGRAVQIETRYIRKLVGELRKMGVDGIVGNWSYAGHLPRALNTYAFGCFGRDPRVTPTRVIDDWAKAVAEGGSWKALAQVLRWIENDSNWHRKLPPQDRLRDLPCRLRTVEEARTALASVAPSPRPSFALPEPPAAYLERLRARLEPRRDP